MILSFKSSIKLTVSFAIMAIGFKSPIAIAGLPEGVIAYNSANYPEAVAQLKPLAMRGNATAQTYLAAMYDYGRGLKMDHKKSLMWFLLAAEQGYDKAQYALGIKYAKGFGVSTSIDEALKWFRLSADNGNDAAKERISEISGEIHRKAPEQQNVQLENFSGKEGEAPTY